MTGSSKGPTTSSLFSVPSDFQLLDAKQHNKMGVVAGQHSQLLLLDTTIVHVTLPNRILSTNQIYH